MNKELLRLGFNGLKNRESLADDVRNEVLALLGDTLNLPLPGAVLTPIAPLPLSGADQIIALCLGHGRAGDEGAVSVDGTSEEDFNLSVINRVAATLKGWGFKVIVVTYYQGNGYTAAMEWLAKELLAKGATCAIEFHFNSSDGKARGHEFLHWSGSVRGVKFAKAMLDQFNGGFPEHPSRGLKAKKGSDRGALFLSRTHCPAVIAEPFFGDNDSEWDLFGSEEGTSRLVTTYAHGIASWATSQAA